MSCNDEFVVTSGGSVIVQMPKATVPQMSHIKKLNNIKNHPDLVFPPLLYSSNIWLSFE